jgi:phosphomannomutase
MQKKLIAFDMDGTLAPSKSTMQPRIIELFIKLLNKYEVCVISGAKYELFEHQMLQHMPDDPEVLKHLHMMPTSGTRYYSYEPASSSWKLEYAEDFTADQKQQIVAALAQGLEQSGYAVEQTYGETIEDRESQITLSILGQDIVAQLGDEGVEIKEAWDPDGSKKLAIRAIVAPLIPDFEVRAAGATSIDVTRPGIDKAYGMHKIIELNNLTKEDILFMGDKIMEGGNDYPVEQMGIDCIAVRSWEDTAYAIEGIIKVS